MELEVEFAKQRAQNVGGGEVDTVNQSEDKSEEDKKDEEPSTDPSAQSKKKNRKDKPDKRNLNPKKRDGAKSESSMFSACVTID